MHMSTGGGADYGVVSLPSLPLAGADYSLPLPVQDTG